MAETFTFGVGAVEVILTDAHGKIRTWYIKSSDVKTVDNMIFWNLKTYDHSARRILSHYVAHDDKDPMRLYKIMARTDVVEHISTLKNAAKKLAVSGGKPCMAKRWRALKSHTKNLLTLPDVVSIHAPDFGDIVGVNINVLPTKGLWIELTHETLTYIAKAMAAQFAAGGVDKVRCKGKKRGAPTAEAANADFEADADQVLDNGDDNSEEQLEGQDNNDDEVVEQCVTGNDASSSVTTPPQKALAQNSVVTPSKTARQSSLFESFQIHDR
jgi:hypothetical protein